MRKIFIALLFMTTLPLSLAYAASPGNDNTGAGVVQFGNVTNSGTISIVISPGQSGAAFIPDTSTPKPARAGADIKAAEGLHLIPYTDQGDNLHIGYGRNLIDKGITHAEAEMLFNNDLAEAQMDLSGDLFAEEWPSLPEKIKSVLINMRYQLGPVRLRRFECMIAAVRAREWPWMALEMRDSRWAEQTPERAARLIEIVESMTTEKNG